jgi:DNA-binding NarL/FixJ family response regulator
VLLDLSLPDSRGLNSFVRLHAALPDVPVVVLAGVRTDPGAPPAQQILDRAAAEAKVAA